jgi:hypothetical protein
MADELRRIMAALRTWNEREGLDFELGPAAPATASALAALEVARAPVAPSHLQLLRLHDGIYGVYRQHGDILPSSYRGERDGQFASCIDVAVVTFFAMDDDGSGACFDRRTRRADGEMDVLEIINYRELRRFESLSEFLLDYRAILESWVTGEAVRSVGRPEPFPDPR